MCAGIILLFLLKSKRFSLCHFPVAQIHIRNCRFQWQRSSRVGQFLTNKLCSYYGRRAEKIYWCHPVSACLCCISMNCDTHTHTQCLNTSTLAHVLKYGWRFLCSQRTIRDGVDKINYAWRADRAVTRYQNVQINFIVESVEWFVRLPFVVSPRERERERSDAIAFIC